MSPIVENARQKKRLLPSLSGILLPLACLLPVIILFVVFQSGRDAASWAFRFGIALICMGASCILFQLPIFSTAKYSSKEVSITRNRNNVINLAGYLILIILGISGIFLEPPLHNLQGEKFRQEGRFEAAVSEFNQGDHFNLKNQLSQTYFLRGQRQFNAGDYDGAVESHLTILQPQLLPNDYAGSAQAWLRVIYNAKGILLEQDQQFIPATLNYEKALTYSYNQELKNSPPDDTLNEALSRNWLMQADTLRAAANFKEALVAYNKATAYKSHFDSASTARARIGTTLFEWGLDLETSQKNYTLALTRYDQVLEDNYNQRAMRQARQQARGLVYLLGNQALGQSQFEQALEFYQRSLTRYDGQPEEIQPYLSRTYLVWGQKLLGEGNFEAALEKLEGGLKQVATPDNIPSYRIAIVKTYRGIGNQLLNDQKYSELVSRLSSVYLNYKESDSEGYLADLLADALTSLAAGYEGQNNYTQASESYNKVFDYIAPDSALAASTHARLARVYGKLASNLEGEGEETRQNQIIDYYQQAVKQADVSGDFELFKEFQQRLATVQITKDWREALAQNLSIGKEYEDKQNYPAAITNYETALNAAKFLKNENARLDLNTRLANLYLNIGLSSEKNGNYSQALEDYDQGVIYAEQTSNSALLESLNAHIAVAQYMDFDKTIQEEDQAAQNLTLTQNELSGLLVDSGLTTCSFVPFVGYGCDLALIGKSLKEGDWGGAALSAVGFVPFVGGFIGNGSKAFKVGERILELQNKLSKLEKLFNEFQHVSRVVNTRYLLRAERLSHSSNVVRTVEKVASKYGHLADPLGVSAGKEFSAEQKRLIIIENMKRNGGVVRSDLSGEVLVPSTQNMRGIPPDPREWQIDHIMPRVKGGTNSYSNAQVLSRQENLAKGGK